MAKSLISIEVPPQFFLRGEAIALFLREVGAAHDRLAKAYEGDEPALDGLRSALKVVLPVCSDLIHRELRLVRCVPAQDNSLLAAGAGDLGAAAGISSGPSNSAARAGEN